MPMMGHYFPECGDKLVWASTDKDIITTEFEGRWSNHRLSFDHDQLEGWLSNGRIERVERITACGWTTVWERTREW